MYVQNLKNCQNKIRFLKNPRKKSIKEKQLKVTIDYVR